MSLPIILLAFILCATLIVIGGSKLSKYGDIIAELTGMGKAWFGLILMAAVTSLPELFTGFSSIVLIHSPDIAVGDIMGSCAFNLFILACLDFYVPQKSLFSLVTKGHLLAAFFGILLLTLSVVSILFENRFPVIGWVSSSSIILLVLYIIAMRIIFYHEKKQVTYSDANIAPTIHPKHPDIPLKLAIQRYIAFAILVIIGGVSLPYFADQLANAAGLSKSFVGTLLVAVSTSLPEIAVSTAAIKIGSPDLAVGNLLGSNIFNMLILSIDDLLFIEGSLLQAINPVHALTGLVAVLMTTIVGISIIYESVTKRFVLGIDDLILILLYASLIISLF